MIPNRRRPTAGFTGWGPFACLLAVAACALSFRLGTPPLFDDPNDGQYAEVAREMALSGDWITPRLNDVVFLNKPPLLYWLIANTFRLFGINETAARLPGVLATLATVTLLFALARSLTDDTTAFLAAAAYVALPSTWIEARFVRPDTLLVASTTGALYAFALLCRDHRPSRRAWYGLQMALAVGLLAKGPLGLLLPAFPIAAVLVVERRGDLARTLLNPRHWLLLLALTAPWHVAVTLRHPGFAWDYVVNQHLLFFLDRKLPRDSIPISLPAFWGAFLARSLPWTLFLPAALGHALRRARHHDAASRGALLALAWSGGVLLFFSAATSRLEHYALPALPAVALLIAVAARSNTSALAYGHGGRTHWFAGALLFAAAAVALPQALAQISWLAPADEVPGIARIFFSVLGVTTLVAALALRRWPLAAVPLLALATLALVPLTHRGMAAVAPLDSSAPVAALIRARTRPQSAVVCEAPIEYQQCAGLAYYLGRAVLMPRPHGFVAPTYLVTESNRLFSTRAALISRWRNQPMVFVSDPLRSPEESLIGRVPGPFVVLGRLAGRWVVANPAALRPRSDPGTAISE